MESAVVQSLLASVAVMKRGCGRFRIDVDTSGGDETYTTLKNSVPFTRVFSKGLKVNGFSQVRLVFPDVGASALAMRDWAGEDGHVVSSFGRSAPEIDANDDCVVCIAPASSEIQQLRSLTERASELGLPLILINPSVKSPGGKLSLLCKLLLYIVVYTTRYSTNYLSSSSAQGSRVPEAKLCRFLQSYPG